MDNSRKPLFRLIWLTAVLLVWFFYFSPERTGATYTNNPPPQPGFTHTPFPGTNDRGYGLQLSGEIVADSSPLLCDLLGNGQKDIVVAGIDGMIYAYRPNGMLLWSFSTGTPIYSSAACGDLNGDGRIAVVIGLGNKNYPSQPEIGNGGVIALEGATGAVRWRFYTMDDEFGTRSDLTDVVYSSPALGDLNGDGKLEIVFGGWDRRIYALDSNGNMLWQYFQLDTVWSSPAIADLDNSGHPAVVVGGDMTANAFLGTPAGGYLYAFNGDGTIRWRVYQDQTIFSSPAVGDITGDGQLDVIVGTGSYYPGFGYHVYAYDRNGNLLPGWPTNTSGYVFSSPALADLNGNGVPDVAVLSQDGYLYAWNGSGSLLWSMYPDGTFHGEPVMTFSPIAADVGGCSFSGASNPASGSPSLLFGKNSDVVVVNSSGVQLTDHPNNATQCTVSIWAEPELVNNSVAVGDIDNDGVLEIVAASSNRFDSTHGYLSAWKVSSASGAKLPWPMFRQNPQHTAVYPRGAFTSFEDAAVVSNTIPPLLPLNYSTTATVSFRNTGSTTWTPGTVNMVPVTGDPLAVVSSYSLPSSVAPGGIVTFAVQLSSPNTNIFATTNWRMNRIGGSNFGLAASRKVKIGNQPAYYVLRGDGHIFNGGLATTPLTPVDTWPFDAARQLAMFYNGAGGYVFDLYGPYHYAPAPGMNYGPNANLPIIPPGYTSVGTESLREVNLYGSTFWEMDINGNFTPAGGQALIASLPSAPGGGQAISFALTPNRDGVYMLKRDGTILRSTNATAIINTPSFPGQDRMRKINATADGSGYYVMDKFGQVWNGGSAASITPTPTIPGGSVAVDFELTADGKGYYLLTQDGAIYAAGTAPPITLNPTPTWTVDAAHGVVARDLVLTDSRVLHPVFLPLILK